MGSDFGNFALGGSRGYTDTLARISEQEHQLQMLREQQAAQKEQFDARMAIEPSPDEARAGRGLEMDFKRRQIEQMPPGDEASMDRGIAREGARADASVRVKQAEEHNDPLLGAASRRDALKADLNKRIGEGRRSQAEAAIAEEDASPRGLEMRRRTNALGAMSAEDALKTSEHTRAYQNAMLALNRAQDTRQAAEAERKIEESLTNTMFQVSAAAAESTEKLWGIQTQSVARHDDMAKDLIRAGVSQGMPPDEAAVQAKAAMEKFLPVEYVFGDPAMLEKLSTEQQVRMRDGFMRAADKSLSYQERLKGIQAASEAGQSVLMEVLKKRIAVGAGGQSPPTRVPLKMRDLDQMRDDEKKTGDKKRELEQQKSRGRNADAPPDPYEWARTFK